MTKTFAIAAAITVLAASWVCAGALHVVSDAADVAQPTPLFVKPGMVVKAEFKSNIKRRPEMELESDALLPEPSSPQVTRRRAAPQTASAPARMTPPTASFDTGASDTSPLAQVRKEADQLELDLEKDLVISPPTTEAGEDATVETEPTLKTRAPAKEETVRRAADAKKTRVRRAASPTRPQYAQRTIQKVRPVTRSGWGVPAGAHRAEQCPPGEYCAERNDYRRVMPPPTTRTYVRDGVTVKLAPAAAHAGQMEYMPEDEFVGDQLIGAAAELIGMPFAFISSFF